MVKDIFMKNILMDMLWQKKIMKITLVIITKKYLKVKNVLIAEDVFNLEILKQFLNFKI